MRLLNLILLSLLLISCADSHQILRTTTQSVKLNKSFPAYISVPKDGRYGQTVYNGSGSTVSQIVLLAFSKHFIQIETGHDYQAYQDALKHAKKNKYRYLIYPSILAWEDRATAWSGLSDKVSVKISIINVNTEKTVDAVIINGKSGLATFGGDRPQDLLAKPISDYADKLF